MPILSAKGVISEQINRVTADLGRMEEPISTARTRLAEITPNLTAARAKVAELETVVRGKASVLESAKASQGRMVEVKASGRARVATARLTVLGQDISDLEESLAEAKRELAEKTIEFKLVAAKHKEAQAILASRLAMQRAALASKARQETRLKNFKEPPLSPWAKKRLLDAMRGRPRRV